MLKETAALIFRIKDFWDITECSPAGDYHCFGGNCCLHSQGKRLLGYDTSLEGGNPADGGSSSSDMVTAHQATLCHKFKRPHY